MSRPEASVSEAGEKHPPPSLLESLQEAKERLYHYRPRFNDRRFWAVQILILLIAGTHSGAEILKGLGYAPYLGTEPRVALASFVTVSLFYVPVVYAALNFGFTGAIATALWCTALTAPNILVLHEGMERLREASQIGIVDIIAVFVGQRVDREMAARRRAEDATSALRASETKYRSLFESTPAAILVLDSSGIILEANPAAGSLFSRPPDTLKGTTLTEVVGRENAGRLLSPDTKRPRAYLAVRRKDGPEVYLEPAITHINSGRDGSALQVLLQDVTEEKQQQAGLRAYATQVLRAQEEERKRIAQELHDDTIQTLVLLCRRLDVAESASDSLPPSVIQELTEARRSAEGIVEELRSFARALRPPTLEDLGLVPSIRGLVLDLSGKVHLEERIRILGEQRRLPADAELGIFRIAQEALRNVERHAQATHISVTIGFTDKEVRLEVKDDGLGFSLPPGSSDFAASGRLGLLGMRERAELLGGRLDIHSTPGKGTTVSTLIPINAYQG